MTLGELIGYARRKVREINPAFFDNNEIMEYINLVSFDYARRAKANPLEADLIWNPDMFSATLPTSWEHIVWARLLNTAENINNDEGTYLVKKGVKARTVGSRMGQGYYIDGQTIFLSPKVEQKSDTILQVRYIPKPYEFVDDTGDFFTESDIPDSLSLGMMQGVLAEMFDQQERETQARRAERKYAQAISDAIKYYRDREGKQEMTIRR